MVTVNHVREGGRARSKSEILGRVRAVMTGGLEELVRAMVLEATEATAARWAREAAARAAELERQSRAQDEASARQRCRSALDSCKPEAA